ncbi:hypothetical protein NHX12_010311 [Muraenolepis orangiensis]|uniref:G-protein coupled receptors family 1 profile domain-containing protein n=1 Tax=Muraenolepis orangiensis TaxID=630683 RepID=A0A9Q0IAB4_9TELE|nr:hypothetical protein NHX12_010311 [Muraenolepis orangiensis]
MENITKLTPLKQPIVFELEGFIVPQGQGPVLFFLALLNYMVVLLANGIVVGIIVKDRTLHRPMNVMICNLAACDMLGGTAVLIRLMIYLATGQKKILYVEAIAQAFSVHTYGAAVQTLLATMAYDRYLAVCEPLRYHAIMTPSRLLFSCVLAWVVALMCIIVLFALNVGTPLCGTTIKHVYCSNRSILRLACEPTPINNIYGLCMSWSLSFIVPQGQGPVLFFLALLNYMVVLLANGMVVGIIVKDRTLHRPMNVLICNLAACDILGGTAVLIRLMIYFATGQRKIVYVEAIAQAFTVHTYGAAVQALLATMAYDRYLAVCEPLRYHAIMTPSRLLFSCVLAWVVALMCIIVLFALNVGTPLCGTTIKHVYCSNRSILRLACFIVPQGQGPVLFFLALLNYMVVLLANGMVVGIIVKDRTLHRPMNVLICNLAACDILGGTAVLIRLMIYFATGQKKIVYVEAIAQAFTVHTYGAAVQTLLATMAYDRYLAVCEPLRYHVIMTPSRLLFSCVLAWVVALMCIIVLFALNVGTPLCGTTIKHVYCSNRSILHLACEPTPINNLYGLCMSWSLTTGCFLVIAFSYIRILHACIKNSSNTSMRSKAFQTYFYVTWAASQRASTQNSTRPPEVVSYFIIEGITGLREIRTVAFAIFLLAYIFILVGNSMIIFLSWTDPKLNSPMFFFLGNLSIVDVLYTTVTIPNMLSGLLTKTHTISVPGCFLQMYFFIQLAVTGRAILTVMAYDRYMAVCNPLQYTAVMTKPVRCLLIAGAWAFGAFCTLPGTAPSWQQTYCGPNVVRHGWCDPSSVRRLVCGDTSSASILSLASALVALLVTGVLILTSYVLISVSLSKKSMAERLRVFGTCAAHLTVVSISYGSASIVYISYRVGKFPVEVRIIVSVLYTVLTPFLNPVIYSLRNKELRNAVKRTLSRHSRPAFSPKMRTNTVCP